jgi:hypothetical protein
MGRIILKLIFKEKTGRVSCASRLSLMLGFVGTVMKTGVP